MKSIRQTLVLISLAAICWTALSNSQTAAQSKTITSETSLSARTLRNGVYRLQDCYDKPIRLRNGKANGSQTYTYGWFCNLEKLALGDINGDGRGDGVVVLGFNGGGSGYFVRLVAMVNRNGRPVQVAVRELGDRVEVKKVSIKNQTVELIMMDHGPNDGLAQVSVKKTITLRLKNKAWQVIKEVEN